MEVNIEDIDIGDMDAQLELIGTLPQRTYRKRVSCSTKAP